MEIYCAEGGRWKGSGGVGGLLELEDVALWILEVGPAALPPLPEDLADRRHAAALSGGLTSSAFG